MNNRNALIALALLACFSAAADPVYGIHIGSKHFPARDFNNSNPGLYVRWGNGATVGAYYNSERRASVYAGYTHEWGPLAVTVGAITGYRRSKILPLVVPSVQIGSIGPANFRLAVLPKIEKGGSTAIHLMAEF